MHYAPSISGCFKLSESYKFIYTLEPGNKVIAIKPTKFTKKRYKILDDENTEPTWYPHMDTTNFQLLTIDNISCFKILDVTYHQIAVKENSYKYHSSWLIPKSIIIKNVAIMSHIACQFNNPTLDEEQSCSPKPTNQQPEPTDKQGFTLKKEIKKLDECYAPGRANEMWGEREAYCD